MTDVTQVVLLSVCRELRSEYAEVVFDIFCILPHSVPVKVASRSTPGGETQDSYNLNGCRYRTILRQENNGRRRTQLPFRGMQAAAFTCAE